MTTVPSSKADSQHDTAAFPHSATAAQANHRPVWLDTHMPEAPALAGDISCDVCVVGGGIAGLLIAERLVDEGMSVSILEQGTMAQGETGHTTAHFVTALDDRYTELERLHGERGARMAAESHAAAIDYVEGLVVRSMAFDCGWRRLDGYLAVNEKHRDRYDRLLDDELLAARRAGIDVERVRTLPDPWPGGLGPALRFRQQAQVHPVILLRAVAKRLMASGVSIYHRTHASKVHGGSNAAVETKAGPIVRCAHVVVATNTPVNNLVAVHTKQAGYQTYVTAFKIPIGALPPILMWDGLWENDVAYRYLRVVSNPFGDNKCDLLVVGGEDHKTGQGPDGDAPYRRLEDWTRRNFPMCTDLERRWSGEVMEPADGLGFIGRNAMDRYNVYVVTGDSGNGMTHAAIGAMIIPDQIIGRDNPWAQLYSPNRKIGLHALGDYVRENVNTAAQYRDWLRKGDVADESEIPHGQGAIISRGFKHLAVYKDEQGVCTRLNARCTHLSGMVHWNSQEKTWDCPCHASRFDKHGKVMHGPANTDLKPEDEREPELDRAPQPITPPSLA